MIDETLLADSQVCPACTTRLTTVERCASCGVALGSPLALRVWELSVAAADLLAQRRAAITALRAEAQAQSAGTTAVRATVPDPDLAVPPRPETSPWRVKNLLVGLGVLLLAVAALIFLVVAWTRVGVGGRTAVMVGATLLAAAASVAAHRRELRSTAEALGALTVGLALLDALGARLAGLAGLGALSGAHFWAPALAVVALAAGVGARVVPLRSWRVAAATLGQVPAWLLATDLVARDAPGPASIGAGTHTVWAAALLTGASAAVFGAVVALSRGPKDARAIVACGLPLTWLAAGGLAVSVLYRGERPVSTGAVLLLLLAAIAVAVARWASRGVAARAGSDSGLGRAWVLAWSGAAWAAAMAPFTRALTDLPERWVPAALGALSAAGLLAVLALVAVVGRQGRTLPREARTGPVAVALLVLAVSLLAVADVVLAVALGPFVHALVPWTATAGVSAQTALFLRIGGRPPELLDVDLSSTALPAMATLVAAAIGLGVIGLLLGRTREGISIGVGLVTVAALVAVPWTGISLLLALVLDLALAAVLVAVAAGARHIDLIDRRVVAGAAAVVFALATFWSLASVGTTAVVAPVAAAALSAVATQAVRRSRALVGRGAAVLATLLGGVAVSALVELVDGPIQVTGFLLAGAAAAVITVTALLIPPAPGVARQVLTAVLGAACVLGVLGVALALEAPRTFLLGCLVLSVGAAVAAGADAAPRRAGWFVGAGAGVLGVTVAACWWGDLAETTTGLVVVIVAGGLTVGARQLGRLFRLPGPEGVLGLEILGIVAICTGVTATVADLDVAWLALLAAAVVAAAVAVDPSRRRAAWLAAGLVLASSWARLAASEVGTPEAYTGPAALALLGLGVLRARRDPALRSWRAYGGALVLLLSPSLIASVTDSALTRPLLLGATALIVLLIGAVRRLAAPLLLGGAALLLDVLIETGPALAAAYAAVPRWASIGAAGLLLLGLGATYERRLAELRGLGRGVRRLS